MILKLLSRFVLQTNWKPVSRSLLQALSDNDTISLYVIEHESKTSLKLDLFTDSGEDSKCDTYQSEEPSNNVDVSLRHEGILEEAVTSEEGTISTTIPLLSDYTSMEFSQKALVGQTVKSPARTAHPHLEMELSNKPAQRKSQVWFGPQDYLKQSQVVFLPSGPTLMGQANSNWSIFKISNTIKSSSKNSDAWMKPLGQYRTVSLWQSFCKCILQ